MGFMQCCTNCNFRRLNSQARSEYPRLQQGGTIHKHILSGSKVSIRSALISAVLRRTIKKQLDSLEDVVQFRENMAKSEGLSAKTPDNVIVTPLNIPCTSGASIPCEWVQMEEASTKPVLLYFHGGCYVFCLLYTSPSPRDRTRSRMPSSA